MGLSSCCKTSKHRYDSTFYAGSSISVSLSTYDIGALKSIDIRVVSASNAEKHRERAQGW